MAYGQYTNPYMMGQSAYNGYPTMGYQGNNNYGYQPPMQNYGYQQQAPAQQQITTTMAFVNGAIEARAYGVAPNSKVYLFDMDGRTFYVKGMDANGMPLPFKTYDYTETVEPQLPAQSYASGMEQQSINMNNYIRRDEVENMIAAEVEKRLASMNTPKAKKGGEVNA